MYMKCGFIKLTIYDIVLGGEFNMEQLLADQKEFMELVSQTLSPKLIQIFKESPIDVQKVRHLIPLCIGLCNVILNTKLYYILP